MCFSGLSFADLVLDKVYYGLAALILGIFIIVLISSYLLLHLCLLVFNYCYAPF